jgi:hypothetical protein
MPFFNEPGHVSPKVNSCDDLKFATMILKKANKSFDQNFSNKMAYVITSSFPLCKKTDAILATIIASDEMDFSNKALSAGYHVHIWLHSGEYRLVYERGFALFALQTDIL